ncbi:hypothetical protein AHAS_Ahas12G0152300 [Arachis hypogaea]
MAILSEHGDTSLPQVPQSCNKSSNWIVMEETLNGHTNISEKSPFYRVSYNSASSTIMDSTLKEIYALSMQYLVRFGFPYFTKDSDWDTDIILMDLKMSIKNKPACEFQWACRKQFNIIERHIAKFFQKRGYASLYN